MGRLTALYKGEHIFPKGQIICLCSHVPMNAGGSCGEWGLLSASPHVKTFFFFFLAAKENKFYSPGTTQHFLPRSIKTSQKPAGLLAGKGAGFLVELLAPCSRLACDVLQTHAWAGEERTGKGRGRDSVVHAEMLNIGGWHVVVHNGLMAFPSVWTCIPTLVSLRQRLGSTGWQRGAQSSPF